MSQLTLRKASFEDLFGLMMLYQKAAARSNEDSLFLDRAKLASALDSQDFLWFVASDDSKIRICISIWIDPKHGLCKIHRIYSDPELSQPYSTLKAVLRELLSFIEKSEVRVDVLYCTTRTLTRDLQALTLEVGFRVMGVFPKALGLDHSGVNGLSIYYFREALRKKRFGEFQLHPKIARLYELAAKSCQLPALSVRSDLPRLNFSKETLPVLEIIQAPQFVARKYHLLKTSRALSDTFYPFVEPDAMVVDPDQKIEVFLRLVPEIRFATIVGERLDTPVHPVSLYKKIISLLNQAGFTYVEVLNDSADTLGTDCILRAGFVPCAYFPSFKAHGDWRRDYVIYAHSLEKLKIHPGDVGTAYLPFVKAYEDLDRESFYES